MNKTLSRLRTITHDCREDMHEPDEQGITAYVFGNILDNAMGNRPAFIGPQFNPSPYMEIVVCVYKEGEREWFNLATLIALARKAKL